MEYAVIFINYVTTYLWPHGFPVLYGAYCFIDANDVTLRYRRMEIICNMNPIICKC